MNHKELHDKLNASIIIRQIGCPEWCGSEQCNGSCEQTSDDALIPFDRFKKLMDQYDLSKEAEIKRV
jgi:hypothetical protein